MKLSGEINICDVFNYRMCPWPVGLSTSLMCSWSEGQSLLVSQWCFFSFFLIISYISDANIA